MIDKFLLLILICLIYPIVQTVKEVILLDTREARDYLNWYKISTNGNINDGWGELSFEAKLFPTLLLSSSTSTLWRTQYVCDITSERRVDNWLRSPYFFRQQAHRIEIELGFSIRDCSTFQTPNEIRSCRETFEIYIHENDSEDNNQLWSSYKLIDIIAGNRFTSNNYGSQSSSSSSNKNNLTVNVKTRGISVTKNGFYIAFRDQGACISLLYVKIFYRLCQDTSIGLINFPETSTGSHLTDIIERYGICAINSKNIQKSLGFCKGNGEWTFQEISLNDSCHCQQGYELLIDHSSRNNILSRAICKVCPIGTYKSTISNHDQCKQCPLNSYTNEKGSTFCICNHGFFRLNSSIFDSSCIGSPNEPEHVTIDEIDQISVGISWKQLNDSVYHIECNHLIPCESYITYQPNRTFINGSNVKISGLDENTNYKIKIYAEQISTHLFSKSIDLSFTTKRSISKQIRDITIRRIAFNTIIITWLSDNFDEYQIRYWSLIDENKKILLTISHNNYTLITTTDLYKFQIRAHTKYGWTSYTDEKLISLRSISIDQIITSNNLIKKNLFFLISPLIILILIILVIVLALIYSKKKRLCRLKTASDCESLDYQKRQVNGHYGPDAFFNSTWTAPLWPLTAKTYIDPHTYEDPTKAVQEFAHEIDPNLIVIESVIGGGEFGDVCRGKLYKSNVHKEVSVAIKTLKQGANEKTLLDFLSEASIMGQFENENVIFLEGVVTKQHPIMIVTEYMENGSLDTYLRTNEGNKRLDALQLTRMLCGIASGMKYLSDMKYVHRDLAARNILVNKDLICKVADFGLSREIDQYGDSYTTKGGKIPIRWTSIEAIDYRKFTSASDVWSFGVLCWEVISFGERPYWNWSNQDVIKAIKNFFRLPPPMTCPDVLYNLMLTCWNEKYLERPKFHEIVQQLTHFIQTPNRLIPLAKQKFPFVNHPDQPNLAQITSIMDWLHNLQFDHLIHLFQINNYINLSQICHFNLKDFHDIIGNHITLNEQTRLLNSLDQIRSQFILISSKSLLTSEGYLV